MEKRHFFKTIEYIDRCHPNLLMHKFLTSTSDDCESGFVRDQRERDSSTEKSYVYDD